MENIIYTCSICSKQFDPKTYSSQYCSLDCSKKAYYQRNAEENRLRAKKWYQDNIEKARERRKKQYWENPEKYRKLARQWSANNPIKKKKSNVVYKDKLRHGGKKKELIKATGLVCSTCGKVGNSFEIIAHHKTFNNKEHEQQELLCRACHCRLHHAVEKKPVTREQIEEAIKNSGNLFEACNKLGLNRSSLYQKRRKLGLL